MSPPPIAVLRCWRKAGRLALVAGWLCLGLGSRAGEYLVQVWGVDEGLAQSSVTDLKQTPDGYLWIGTLLGGLARFDGLRFENFNTLNTPELINPGVRRLLADSEGILWINDYGGNLLRRQNNQFIREELRDVQFGSLVLDRPGWRVFSTLTGDLISGRQDSRGGWDWQRFKLPHAGGSPYYVADEEGVLWYRHPSSTFGRFKDGEFELWEQPPGLRGTQLQTLAQTRGNQVWVGTESELARWTGTTFLPVIPANGETNLLVRHIVPLPDGRLWIEANGRLRLLDGDRWVKEAVEWDGNSLPWSRVRMMRSDDEGGLWISLREEGLVHVRADGSLRRITTEDGLPSQLVQAFQPDDEGNLWTGYHRGGLVRVRRALFRSVSRAEGLDDTVVTSVTEDSAGAVWLGTSSGSVARWRDGNLVNFTLPLRGTFCQEAVVCAGLDGQVWIGTGGNGLLVHSNNAFHHVLLPGSVPQGVRSLLGRRDGSVWFANFSGLYRVAGRQSLPVLDFKRTSEVAGALAEGPDGVLWMGTLGGTLMRPEGDGWRRFSPSDGRPASRFWALLPEADGSVWIGTLDQGLLHFSGGKFTRFTHESGLADDSVSQILFDGEDLWLATRIGVVRVSRAALLRRVKGQGGDIVSRVFSRGNGLLTTAMALEFGPNCVRGRDGRLWFSSANGVAWTSPASVGHRQVAPPVIIEGVHADGKAVALPHALLNLEGRRDSGGLQLGPGLRNLEIRYTAPNLTAPELVKFRYRLEDLDSEWQEVGARRSLTFPRLPPGRYRFHLSACNSDGVWSGEGATLTLTVRPHLWERRSFQAGGVLMFGGAGLVLMRLATKRRMQRKLDRLERQRALERERTRIAQDLHDELGAGLTEISLTSDLARNPEVEAEVSRHYIGEIGSKSRELVSAMDEIVWAINPRNDSLSSLAAYFCQYAQRLLSSAGIRCRLDVSENLPAAPLNLDQRHQLFLAFKEAINNIIRHAGATEVLLGIRVERGNLLVRLQDDGRGLGDQAADAGADGLLNMRERLGRLGGGCQVVSGPDSGTQVVFCVPLPAAEM